MREDFAIFIMSYNRINCTTLNTLHTHGYTGKYYIVVGDDDPILDQYKEKYGEHLLVFNKDKVKQEMGFDDYDGDRGSKKVILYARNFCMQVAPKLGLKYACQFDDDYRYLEYRYQEGTKLRIKRMDYFDDACNAMIDFLENTGADTVAWMQGGDMIGGYDSSGWKQKVKRKVMNSFYWRCDKPIVFNGSINEDVSMYLEKGRIGKLCLSPCDVTIGQKATQSNKGGMTETYEDNGTYLKSFYSVIANPSCCKVGCMIADHQRIHHKITWNYACPKIIREEHRRY